MQGSRPHACACRCCGSASTQLHAASPLPLPLLPAAICFVLGISNLSQVRASNLSELVYKQGQGGVTKATVSIVFNNADTKASPIGYEHCETITVSRTVRCARAPSHCTVPQACCDVRTHCGCSGDARMQCWMVQVVIGGRNKYLINGHTVQATAVQNLFHSVQLNVNNPHFLIMQVRAVRRVLASLERCTHTRACVQPHAGIGRNPAAIECRAASRRC